jgi:NAD(P)-dependent dehydrogenase (short-subunit alcohol dehydrogenase family)
VERLLARFGRLDVALANAGFSVPGRIEELTGDDWRRQLDTNVVGAALTARAAIGALERTRGRLALTGSVAGFVPAPSFGAYHASKYALRALGATLALELAPRGVSCTLLHPGFVVSEIAQVDGQGHFDPSRADKRPHRFMWPTDRAARVMVDAIYRRKREMVFTGHGRAAAWLGMHFPSLIHLVMSSSAMQRQASAVRGEDT